MSGWRRSQSDSLDRLLTGLFLTGIYLGIAVNLPGGTPVPAALAGAAGLAMVAKHCASIRQAEAFAIVAILVVGVASIALAPDPGLLGERLKGFIQFAYSIVIGFGFFLTAKQIGSTWLNRFCLAFALAILAAAALETLLPSVRALSDAFRTWAFNYGVYDADIRDMALYGRVRPKVFTSEPSFAAFGFTLFSFAWYSLSPSRLKLPLFLGLLGAGYLILRGPTVLLGAPLIAVHQVLLAARRAGPAGRSTDWTRVFLGLVIAAMVGVAAAVAGSVLLADRLYDIAAGRDPSFFSRIIAPPLVAAKIVSQHPVTGAGLSGWEYIEPTVAQLYASSSWLGMEYTFDSAAYAITNFFWLHWIFLGLGFGILMLAVVTGYLRILGVPCLLYCWAVWTVFGQAAGGYVDPRTWTVLMLAAVIATIHEREASALHQPTARMAMAYGRTSVASQ